MVGLKFSNTSAVITPKSNLAMLPNSNSRYGQNNNNASSALSSISKPPKATNFLLLLNVMKSMVELGSKQIQRGDVFLEVDLRPTLLLRASSDHVLSSTIIVNDIGHSELNTSNILSKMISIWKAIASEDSLLTNDNIEMLAEVGLVLRIISCKIGADSNIFKQLVAFCYSICGHGSDSDCTFPYNSKVASIALSSTAEFQEATKMVDGLNVIVCEIICSLSKELGHMLSESVNELSCKQLIECIDTALQFEVAIMSDYVQA